MWLAVIVVLVTSLPSISKADVPIGTILPFYGTQEQRPEGYLFCDGREFLRDQYPELYEHLVNANPDLHVDDDKAKLPDLRGEFLRGVDFGRGIDTEREAEEGHTLGSVQDSQAAVTKHDHKLSQNHSVSWGWSGGWGRAGNTKAVNYHPSTRPDRDPNPHRQAPGLGSDPYMTVLPEATAPDIETRPRNIAVNFIIRAWQ